MHVINLNEEFTPCACTRNKVMSSVIMVAGVIVLKRMLINIITIVSQASTHSRVSAHVPNFKGSLLQLPYKHTEFISREAPMWAKIISYI